MAKLLKGLTKKERRRLEGEIKNSLNVVLSFVEVGVNEISSKSQLNKKEQTQLNKIKRWLKESWNYVHLPSFSQTHRNRAEQKIQAIQNILAYHWSQHKEEIDGVGIYATMWILISMLVDDAPRIAWDKVPREWQYLQTTISTWTAYLLGVTKTPNKAEEVGGAIALSAWDILLLPIKKKVEEGAHYAKRISNPKGSFPVFRYFS